MFSEFTGPHSDVYSVQSNAVQKFLNQDISSSGLIRGGLKLCPHCTVHYLCTSGCVYIRLRYVHTYVLVNFEDCLVYI